MISALNKLYLKRGLLMVRIARNRKAHRATAADQKALERIVVKILKKECK